MLWGYCSFQAVNNGRLVYHQDRYDCQVDIALVLMDDASDCSVAAAAAACTLLVAFAGA
jgi:hypothetical protein